jgi:hypothetical protein
LWPIPPFVFPAFNRLAANGGLKGIPYRLERNVMRFPYWFLHELSYHKKNNKPVRSRRGWIRH